MGWVQKLGKNEAGEGRHDPSGWKDEHVKALKQQRACIFHVRVWGIKGEGAPKMTLQEPAAETRDFIGL